MHFIFLFFYIYLFISYFLLYSMTFIQYVFCNALCKNCLKDAIEIKLYILNPNRVIRILYHPESLFDNDRLTCLLQS